MSVNKIIKYSKSTKSKIYKHGFSQLLECDVKRNTNKYLDDLLKFKDIAKHNIYHAFIFKFAGS
jgi:hypothetical protein